MKKHQHNYENQPSEFHVDTEDTWDVVTIIQPDRGVVYTHRKTGAPLVIMSYAPGKHIDNTQWIYVVYSLILSSLTPNLHEIGASEAGQEMSIYLHCVDLFYDLNIHEPLDPSVLANFMKTIGLHPAEDERKIVKVNRQKKLS